MSSTSALVIAASGKDMGPRYITHFASLDTKVDTSTAFVASVFDPSELDSVKSSIDIHVAGAWNNLTISFNPGPGIFGHTVGLHYGFSRPGALAPTTIAGMRKLKGYRYHTFGGAADPSTASRDVPFPFDDAMHNIAFSSSLSIVGHVKLYYCFTQTSFGPKQGTGDCFELTVNGNYQVYGLYI